MNTERKIELRSEEVQEILTRPPHALVRWGITIFFCIMALFFIGGCFFKYPDILNASITVTTENPPVWIVARSTGKLQEMYIEDNDSVNAGQIIAVLENPASTSDVLRLKSDLVQFNLTDSCFKDKQFVEDLALGNIQSAYNAFLRNLTDYHNFLSINLYQQKIDATQKELREYRNYIEHLRKQIELDKTREKIASNSHNREKTLYDKGLISRAEYEEAQQIFLSKQQTGEQMQTSISSAKIQEAQLEQNILQTEMEKTREANSLKTTLTAAYNDLLTAISNWELSYIFISPIDGVLSYNQIWQVNQNVITGDKVFSVVNGERGAVIGKIKLPVSGSGKVKTGQRVNIQMYGYPYLEYGFLTGTITSISLMADDDENYAITVSIPQNLQTSYGKVLDLKGELTGSAEVMADERSVIERLFNPLRYLWERYS